LSNFAQLGQVENTDSVHQQIVLPDSSTGFRVGDDPQRFLRSSIPSKLDHSGSIPVPKQIRNIPSVPENPCLSAANAPNQLDGVLFPPTVQAFTAVSQSIHVGKPE
jgi:hypothetical protein